MEEPSESRMQAPKKPANEDARLAALAELDIEPSDDTDIFDGLAQLAAHMLGVPIALVSVFTGNEQWIRSRVGLDVRVAPRDMTFCGHVVEAGAPVILRDAREDVRFADNPAVSGEPHIRFYAGMPLSSEEGYTLGTLCVIDRTPRDIDPEALRLLELLARQAAAQLDRRRKDRNLGREKLRLQESEARLRAVFDAMTEGVTLMDSSGQASVLNAAASRIYANLGSAPADFSRVRHEDGSDFPRPEWPLLRAYHDRVPGTDVVMQVEHPEGVTWLSVNAAPVELPTGPGAIATFHDVTSRVQAQQAVQRSELTLRTVLSAAPIGVVLARGDQLLYVNAALVRILGYPDESALVGGSPTVFVHPNSRDFVRERLSSLAEGQNLPPTIVDCVRYDGTNIRVEVTPVVVNLEGGAGHITLLRDVSEQLRAEQARAEAQRALQQSLAEKETLLQEVHHRVKNNLQVVASLLNLQGRQLTDPGAREIFAATKHRVQAIALLHEGLYRSPDLASIELGPYLERVVQEVTAASCDPERLRVTCAAPGLSCDMDAAVPLGLIVNELISNAVKHAFAPGATGQVEVRIDGDASGMATLRVRDNGRGLPPDFKVSQTRSLGVRLVTNLTAQLGGELNVESDAGVCWSVRFPLAS
jgi:PAS domain S-box-containing protein